jgi:hypothetical protein
MGIAAKNNFSCAVGNPGCGSAGANTCTGGTTISGGTIYLTGSSSGGGPSDPHAEWAAPPAVP